MLALLSFSHYHDLPLVLGLLWQNTCDETKNALHPVSMTFFCGVHTNVLVTYVCNMLMYPYTCVQCTV